MPSKMIGSIFTHGPSFFFAGGTASAKASSPAVAADHARVFSLSLNASAWTHFNERYPRTSGVERYISALFVDPIVISSLHAHGICTPTVNLNSIYIGALSGSGYQHEAILTTQQNDESTKDLWHYMQNGQLPPNSKDIKFIQGVASRCFLENNIIYRRGGIHGKQLLVHLCLRDELLASVHDAPWSGHVGVQRTLSR